MRLRNNPWKPHPPPPLQGPPISSGPRRSSRHGAATRSIVDLLLTDAPKAPALVSPRTAVGHDSARRSFFLKPQTCYPPPSTAAQACAPPPVALVLRAGLTKGRGGLTCVGPLHFLLKSGHGEGIWRWANPASTNVRREEIRTLSVRMDERSEREVVGAVDLLGCHLAFCKWGAPLSSSLFATDSTQRYQSPTEDPNDEANQAAPAPLLLPRNDVFGLVGSAAAATSSIWKRSSDGEAELLLLRLQIHAGSELEQGAGEETALLGLLLLRLQLRAGTELEQAAGEEAALLGCCSSAAAPRGKRARARSRGGGSAARPPWWRRSRASRVGRYCSPWVVVERMVDLDSTPWSSIPPHDSTGRFNVVELDSGAEPLSVRWSSTRHEEPVRRRCPRSTEPAARSVALPPRAAPVVGPPPRGNFASPAMHDAKCVPPLGHPLEGEMDT
nr:unnamed protein product [Digitaria exilis]